MGDERVERVERLASLRVRIEAPDLTNDDLDGLTRQLRSELRDSTDADQVDLVGSGPAPTGSKGSEALLLGDLAIRVLPAALPGVIAVLRGWLRRHQRGEMRVMVRVGERAVDLEYPVGEMTRDDLMKLIAVVTAEPVDGAPQV